MLLLIIIFFISNTYTVTAYCPCEQCCGIYADGITANGHVLVANDKVIAAPVGVNFGARFFVPGYGLGIVRDRGGSIKGKRLDVYFSTHERALQWGRQILICLEM